MGFINNIHHLNFLKKKPCVIPRIVKDLFYVRVLDEPRLRTVDFAITYRCNGRCLMCSAKELMKIKGIELTPDEIIDTMKQAVNLGAIHMNLTGGEPTMRDWLEISKIICGVNKLNLLISMVTNSKKMSLFDITVYAKHGLDTLQLSIESMDAETHNKTRNAKGNWQKVMRLFKWAKKLKLNICLSVVITKDNFDEVKRIIEFGKQNDAFVLLNPISGYPELSIKDKMDEYYELLKEGHVRADTIINFRGGSGCPAGIERIYITPYGDVHTCPHVHKSYGNIRKETLAEIYERICASPLMEYKKHCRHILG